MNEATPAQLAPYVTSGAFLLAFVFGAVGNRTNFCTMGAVSDWINVGDTSRLRMWLLAIAVALLGSSALQLAGVVDLTKSIYTGPNFTWLSYIVGGLLFGVGFALAGYCPGTCVVGAAEGRKDALFTLLGGVVGAAAFTAAYPVVEAVFIKPLNFGKLTLADLVHAPALAVAIGLALVLLAVVTLVPTRLKRPS